MKIFLLGAEGRMGREIQKSVRVQKKDQIVGGVARNENKRKNFYPTLPDSGISIDVIVDFSSPELFRQGLKFAEKNKVAFLSGTTGLSKSDFLLLKKAGRKIPVLWTANTSLGIQIFKNTLAALQIPNDFEIQMTEWHHVHKKDKPSGTAIVLQSILLGKRNQLPEPVSIRKGKIVGTHRIQIKSKEEILTFEHKALSRAVFAKGAVFVAQWLKKKKPGLYRMEDCLKP